MLKSSVICLERNNCSLSAACSKISVSGRWIQGWIYWPCYSFKDGYWLLFPRSSLILRLKLMFHQPVRCAEGLRAEERLWLSLLSLTNYPSMTSFEIEIVDWIHLHNCSLNHVEIHYWTKIKFMSTSNVCRLFTRLPMMSLTCPMKESLDLPEAWQAWSQYNGDITGFRNNANIMNIPSSHLS